MKSEPFAPPVILDNRKAAEFVPITDADVPPMRRWKTLVGETGNPNKRNAAEFAALAIQRWKEAKAGKAVADSIAELTHFIQDNPRVDVTLFVGVKANWKKRDRLLGVCLLRRTWANNIYVHYITSHPEYCKGGKWEGIGVGTAIAYCLTEIAKRINAGAVWGETTQNSVKFYEKLLGTSGMKDRLYIKKRKYERLNAVLKKNLRT